jgi:maleylacetate reductase
MNAIAHAVEALCAKDKNPIISLMGSEGIAALARALPRITKQRHDVEARSDALYGAWLCGICLGAVGMALHHKLCHVLGGIFNLPHAEMHTIILPPSVAYSRSAAGEAMNRVQIALGVTDAATGLTSWPAGSALHARSKKLACQQTASMQRSTRHSPIPIGIHGRLSVRRSTTC